MREAALTSYERFSERRGAQAGKPPKLLDSLCDEGSQADFLSRVDSGRNKRSGKRGASYKHPLVIPKNSIYSGRGSHKDLSLIHI